MNSLFDTSAYELQEMHDRTEMCAAFIDTGNGMMIVARKPTAGDPFGIEFALRDRDGKEMHITLDAEACAKFLLYMSMYSDALHRVRTKAMFVDIGEWKVPTLRDWKEKAHRYNGSQNTA